MPIPALGSLAWHDSWTGFGEGPYTLLAKLSALNSVSKNYFDRQMQSPRLSFAGPTNLRSNNPVVKRLLQATLGAQLGMRFGQLAGDARLRYCQECLKGGYQAVINQLDGLERCPVHGTSLFDCCRSCGRPTPPYAFERPGKLPSFTCGHCRQPFAGDGKAGIGVWHLPESLGAVRAFHAWAAAVTAKVILVAPANWITCAPATASETRAALLTMLSRYGPNISTLHFAPHDVNCVMLNRLGSNDRPPGNLGYSDLAGSILPVVALNYTYWHGWATLGHGIMVPTDLAVPIEVHAAFIWRRQFESGEQLVYGPLPSSAEPLNDFVWRWQSTSDLIPKRLTMEDRVAVAHAAWRAAMRIAQAWRGYLVAGQGQGRRLVVTEDWAARLGRWALHAQSPLGVVIEPRATGPLRLWIFLV